MPVLAQRQFYGIALLFLAFGVVAMIDRAAAPYAGAVALIGAVTIVMAGGGASGPSLAPLRDAIDRARAGKRPEPPPGAPLELVEIYGALAQFSDDASALGKTSREKNAEIDAALGQVET